MNPWSLLSVEIVDRPGDAHVPSTPSPTRCHRLLAALETKIIDPTIVQQAHARMPGNPWGLSRRQLQVLELSVQGCNRKAIAARLNITLSTAAQHLASVRQRMELTTTAQVVIAWHRHYRIVGTPNSGEVADQILIKNLARATAELRAHRAP